MQTSQPTPTVASLDAHAAKQEGARGVAPFKDVWSRSGSKYRLRAVVLLAVNVLLFAGVGCFAYWIRSGVVFAPAMEGYRDQFVQTFNFGRHTTVSLADLLIAPISIQDVPMQIPIIGLLMATLIAIPILVSILYRFWSSLPFILVVGVLAVMPWLAITLLGSCIIASIRPFSMRFRFISGVAGLVPIVVYLALAWHGSAELVMGRFDPIDRVKFIAPWVLAIVAATLLFAIVLTIAKLVDYRPGAITPLLALMFGLPVGLFEFRVGRDELHYRLLEDLNAHHFDEVDASVGLREAAERTWARHPLPRPRREKLLEVEKQKWQFKLASDLAPFKSELTRHQGELVDRCDWFLKRFPQSRYALNVLYIKGRALDMRVDPVEFRQNKWIRFYDDFPADASLETWRIALANGSESVISAVALLKLSQLHARRGDVDRAMDELGTLMRRFTVGRTSPAAADTARVAHKGVLERDLPEASLRISLERILLQAHRLHDLLTLNRDPIYDYDPISGERRPGRRSSLGFGLLDLDPRHQRYRANLRELKHQYPNCQIEDNIDLEIAEATPARVVDVETGRLVVPNPSKIQLLEACLASYPNGDAVPEALFRLAVAYRSDGKAVRSEATFGRLFNEHPDSVWAREATRQTHSRSNSNGTKP